MKKIFATLLLATTLAACGSETTARAQSSTDSSVVTVTSSQDFAATESQLREALATRDLKLFTVVDHGAGAKSVGEDIGKSKLFIFGSPKSGTPLMIAEPKLGLELPMKILVHEAEGDVHLYRTNIAETVQAYGVTDKTEMLNKISETLDAIIAEAAAN